MRKPIPTPQHTVAKATAQQPIQEKSVMQTAIQLINNLSVLGLTVLALILVVKR